MTNGSNAICQSLALDSFFPTTAHFARIFSTVVLSDFEIRTSDLRLRRARVKCVNCEVCNCHFGAESADFERQRGFRSRNGWTFAIPSY